VVGEKSEEFCDLPENAVGGNCEEVIWSVNCYCNE